MIRFKKSYLFFVAVLVCGVGILGSMTGVAKADVTSTSISTPTFRIMTQSDSGDYIGQNKSWDFSSSNNSKITISQASNSTVSFNASSFSISNMSFGFAAESGKTLSPGLHTPAKRLPFRDFFNGIDIGGDGRGCNTILGAFYVHEYVMNNGVLQKAAIDFVQICGPKSTDINAVVPKLYGSLRYNSTIPDSCNSQGCADVKKNVGITVVPVKPDLIISDIKIEKREGDSWKYIYVTVKNNGGDALPFNQIMGITIKDLDTGKIYGSGLTDRIIVGYNKDVSSADPIVEKSSGIYNLEATVDTKIEKSSGTYTDAYNESNENNNTFTKTITISNSNKPDLKIDGVSVMPIRDNPNAKDIGVYFNRLSSQDFKQYRIKLYDKTSGYTDYKTVISYAQGNVDFFLNPGKYNLLFTIDNDNVIDESNENDNTFTKTVVVAEQAPAKTCLELENIQQKYFNICRDNGFFSDVCFNKFSGEYQGCGKSLKNDCTENNLNADKNIRCSIPMQGLEFQWYVIPSSYYNVTPDGISNGIMGEYGMQGRINETCSNICAAKNLKAEPKCAGWNDIKNACRKTGTINNLMSAGSSCNEINSNSQTGLDYCCCGNSVNNDINISSCVKEGESL
ncbi:MAG: hypothetical protein ABIJ83_04245, partial [Patescibacteria group bacterium]|nr:hypothetical protein [Patescibacteria group bacterium]MBU0879799.1 hypothetical protein [Patescibacteria group bacterium]MBU2214587.1 hypothetical protein [Patescibacteria group bacterium]